jgi:hypothetical protein
VKTFIQIIAGPNRPQLRRLTMLQRAYSALSLVLAGLLLAPLAVAQTVTGEVTDANNTVGQVPY